MLGLGLISPILPLYMREFGASGLQLGLVFAAFSVARLVLGPLHGRLSDRLGRKPLILTGLGLYALISWAYALAGSLWQVALLRFLQGAASTLVTPLAQAYIGDRTPRGQEGRTMNTFYTSVFVGMGLGPLLGGALAERWGLRAPFYAMGLLAVAAGLAVALLVPENRAGKAGTRTAAPWTKLLRVSDVWGIVAYMSARGFWRQAFNAFWPLMAAQKGYGESLIGAVLTVYFVGESFFQIPAGFLADRISRRLQTLLGGILAAAPLFAVPWVGAAGPMVGLSLMMGAASALGRGSVLALRTELGRVYGMGVLAGVQEAAFSLGQALGPTVAGAAYNLGGAAGSMYLAGGLGLLGALLGAVTLSSAKAAESEAPSPARGGASSPGA